MDDIQSYSHSLQRRAKSNMKSRRVYSAPTDRRTGVIADQTIVLIGVKSSQDYPVHLRRIRFKRSRFWQGVDIFDQ